MNAPTLANIDAMIAKTEALIEQASAQGDSDTAVFEMMFLGKLRARRAERLVAEARLQDQVPLDVRGSHEPLMFAQPCRVGRRRRLFDQLIDAAKQFLSGFGRLKRKQIQEQALERELAGRGLHGRIAEGQHPVLSCGSQPGVEAETSAGASPRSAAKPGAGA